MSDPAARTFTSDFRRFFLRGLVVLLPSVLTLWIVVKAYQFVDNTIAQPINQGVRTALVNTARVWEPLDHYFEPAPEQVDKRLAELKPSERTDDARGGIRREVQGEMIEAWWADRWYTNIIGILVAIVAVYIAGRLLGGFFGRRIYRRIEGMITTLPVFKQVYPYVKQIVDFLFSDDKPIKFNRVVVVEYPRKGIWSLGFMTGGTMQAIAAESGDAVTVFIPSSPTPFTGYTITVKRSEAIEVPISVDEALRFSISGGVLVPNRQAIEGDDQSNSGLIPLPTPSSKADEPDVPDDKTSREEPRQRDAG